MPVMKRRCSICEHETQQVSGCGRPECELAESVGVEGIHDHCAHDQDNHVTGLEGRCDYDHPLCTPRGCRGVPVPTGFVNPDLISGEIPDPMSKNELRDLVTEVTGGFTDDSESGA